jgi:thioesterase domain-containing protein/acyl carrier protein
MTPIPSKAAGTFCDLNFFLVERADGWRASVDVNGDVFHVETGEQMLHRFAKLLESVASNPSQKISAIDFPPVLRKSRQRGEAPEVSACYVAPRTAVEEKIASIWEDILRVRPIGVTANFVDLGGHSLLAVPLLVRIKEQFGLSIPLAQLFADPTVEAMARVIERPGPAEAKKVVPIQPAGSRHPFFMIGGDHWFRHLARRLGPDQPFLGLSLQPYEQLPKPATFQEIANDLAALLVEIHPEGPFFLGGWCVDGAVAYEVGQRLTAMGREVGLIVLMDVVNPFYKRVCRTKLSSATRLARRIVDLVRDAGRLQGRDAGRHFRDGLLDISARVQRALFPSRYGEEPDQAIIQNDPSRQEFRCLLYRSEDLYTPGPNRTPLLLIRSQVDRYQDPDLGWRKVALGGLETVEVPGDHIGMFREPEVEAVAAALWNRLEPLS